MGGQKKEGEIRPRGAIHKMSDKGLLRLTIFPPSGPRIELLIASWTINGTVLNYRDRDGIDVQTTLPYAIEQIPEGHKKAPFHLE
jgi:hypothetical protein